jgi:hypothetical protein
MTNFYYLNVYKYQYELIFFLNYGFYKINNCQYLLIKIEELVR